MASTESLLRTRFASLRWKMIFYFLLGIVIPILITVWISNRESLSIIRQRSLEQQEKVLLETARHIWDLEDQSRRQLSALAAEPELGRALYADTPPPAALMEIFLRLNPRWEYVILFDRLGRVVWSQGPLNENPGEDPFFLETFNLGQSQTPVYYEGDHCLTRMGTTILHEGTFVGVLTASLNLAVVQQTLRQLRGRSGSSALIWDDGGTIFGTSLSTPESGQLRQQIDLLKAGREILNSGGKTLYLEADLNGEPMVLSAVSVPEFISRLDPIPGENWFLALITPSAQTFGGLWTFQRQILLFLIFLFGAMGMVLLWLSRKITRPFEQMADFANRVSRGERKLRLQVSGTGEVAELSRSLNHMASSLRHYEQELVRSEVLASLGRMSSVTAHEIRNPLNAIKVAVQYLQMKQQHDPVVAEYSTIILNKVDRVARFTQSLLKLSRLPTPELQPQNLVRLIEQALQPLRQQAGPRHIEFRLELNGVETVQGDEDQLTELIQNVVQNSLDALGETGEVVIRADRDDGWTILEFQDDGPGLPAEMKDRLFLPFSTTRRQGTGLGLWLCRMVAVNHQGSFDHRITERGACFILKIPDSR